MPITGALDRIEQMVPFLPKSEEDVGRWILAHPEQLATMRVQDLASSCKRSQAAVIRFCKSLQFKGYTELKVSVIADLSQQHYPNQGFSEIRSDSPFHSSMLALEYGATQSIRDTLRNVTEDSLAQVAQMVHTSRRILVFGVGASGIVAKDIQQKLLRLGYIAMLSDDFHTAVLAGAGLSKEDLCVEISQSGETLEVIELAQMVKNQGCRLVAITGYGKNALANLSDVVFLVNAVEPKIRIGATSSRLAALIIADLLLLYLANRFSDSVAPYLVATRGAVESHSKYK